MASSELSTESNAAQKVRLPSCVTIQFRPGEQIFSAVSKIPNLKRDEVVMVQTDHGLEPAVIRADNLPCPPAAEEGDDTPLNRLGSFLVVRRANREEKEKYQRLLVREKEAFKICQKFIDKHGLPMNLVKVERFFNGSKIIFYFTAENRVDFRALVKDLVQEFRTRIEIRQIGVRHETKMIGGLGCCGRELCCATFIKNFAPVSIKMAKEQGLPLNPGKISGICNRLLCCLTYEFDTYHQIRKRMPKQGKTVVLDGRNYKVTRINALDETVEAVPVDDPGQAVLWREEEWSRALPAFPSNKPSRKKKKKEPKQPA